MEAIKQIMKVSKDHKIIMTVPPYIPENEIVEMIMIIKKRPDSFNQKIKELKEAVKDELFLNDIEDISEDFKVVDLQGWKQDDGI
ncbi:MAG: hypothetical protein STSR0008_23010 [Ignavibacterium sp.]